MTYNLKTKIPMIGFALLTMGGCANTQEQDAEKFCVVDTVVVLEYVHPSQYSGRKIWVADKNGREIYSNNVSLGPKPAVAPRKGEEIVIERGINRYGVTYVMVRENLAAQRLKQEYIRQK